MTRWDMPPCCEISIISPHSSQSLAQRPMCDAAVRRKNKNFSYCFHGGPPRCLQQVGLFCRCGLPSGIPLTKTAPSTQVSNCGSHKRRQWRRCVCMHFSCLDAQNLSMVSVSGTDAGVYCKLGGAKGESQHLSLEPQGPGQLDRGATDVWVLQAQDVGELQYIVVRP